MTSRTTKISSSSHYNKHELDALDLPTHGLDHHRKKGILDSSKLEDMGTVTLEKETLSFNNSS